MVIKLSGVQFGLTHYFLTFILKSPKYSTWSVQIFIYAVLSQSEIKFIHFFFWGGGESKSFGNKNRKIWHGTPPFSCNLIGYFKQALKSDWLFCFYGNLLIGWEKDVI